MIYGSVCSGIEAASVAWHPLGWRAAWLSEIDAFPCRVLAHHYPDTPNLGDMTQFKDWPDAAIDVLVGGTPCQSFSIAGLRRGLDDLRGNLMLTYLAIASRYRPRWLVWENVPGVLSSNGGRDFGSLLGGVAELGYGFAYRVLDAQYVRVDGLGRAVPQRRRRVFFVGCLGDWRRAAAVLFERESLCGNPAPRRKAGAGIAGTLAAGTFDGSPCGGDGRETSLTHVSAVCQTLSAGGNSTCGSRQPGMSADTAESLLAVAHTLRGSGFDASEDGTGRGIPLVVMAHGQGGAEIAINGEAPTLTCNHEAPIISFHGSQDPYVSGDVTHPVGRNQGLETCAIIGSSVRRLMPIECERLQGFPDNYTNIPKAKDRPRYKAIGNSMAVNVMRWIGQRIDMVDNIRSAE